MNDEIYWNDGMLEKWKDGMAPFGQINACGGSLNERWFCRHSTLTNHGMKCHYSIIPPFHYSWLEEKEWLAGAPLLSSIFRHFDTFEEVSVGR